MSRILYIIDKPNLYGSELHLYDLIQYIKQQNEVMVIAFAEGPLLSKITNIGVNSDVIEITWLPKISNIRKIINRIKIFKPDLIHSHQPKATLWGGILGFLLKRRRICTIHSSIGDTATLKHHVWNKIMTQLFHFSIQYLSELFTCKTIFVSEMSRSKSFYKKKSFVIYNWVKIPCEAPHRIVTDLGKIKILSIGSISINKGIDILLAFLLKIKTPYQINIVGSGNNDYVGQIKTEFEKNNINVNFCGYQEDTQKFYTDADVFIMFSRAETFGLVYAEAAAYGLPIFARELPVLKEILPINNYLSNDIDELVISFNSLMHNQELYDQISCINKQWALSKFDYIKNVKEIEKIYKDVIAS